MSVDREGLRRAAEDDLAAAEVALAERDDWIRLQVTHLAVSGRIDGGCGRTVVEALTTSTRTPSGPREAHERQER